MLALYLKVSLTLAQAGLVQFPSTVKFPWIKWVCGIENIGNHFEKTKLFWYSESKVYILLLSDFKSTKINSSLVASLLSWWRWLSTGAETDQVRDQSNLKHSIWKARNVGHWSEQESILEVKRFSRFGKTYGTLSNRQGWGGLVFKSNYWAPMLLTQFL